jgi:hypothetical protein
MWAAILRAYPFDLFVRGVELTKIPGSSGHGEPLRCAARPREPGLQPFGIGAGFDRLRSPLVEA